MDIESLAHRMAWRYSKSTDPNHSDTYTFNRTTLLSFVNRIIEHEREECAQACLDRAKDTPGKMKTPFAYKEEAILCAATIRARSNAK